MWLKDEGTEGGGGIDELCSLRSAQRQNFNTFSNFYGFHNIWGGKLTNGVSNIQLQKPHI